MQYPSSRWARLGASGLLLVCVAGATSVIQLSFEELVDHSETIVSGQVTRSWAAWDDEHKFIWTHYEVTVSAVHKGTPGATVVVSEAGGTLDGRVMTIAGTITYQGGENVLVFLTRVPNGYLRTTGWGQGKYTVDGKGILHGGASLRAGTSIASLEGMSAAQVHALVVARPGVTR
jgi:hypothetical protein